MRLFLDASVLLAASGSTKGASREIFRLAPLNDWVLLATPYVLEETVGNLPALPLEASAAWIPLRNGLVICDDSMSA